MVYDWSSLVANCACGFLDAERDFWCVLTVRIFKGPRGACAATTALSTVARVWLVLADVALVAAGEEDRRLPTLKGSLLLRGY